MTITNIGTLQAAAESWLERSDISDALFLEFANSVADKLMRGVLAPDGRTWIVPPLRIAAMLTTATLTTSGASVALPADWLEFERVWIDATDGKDLLFTPVRQFRSDPDSQLTGTPIKYTIDGGTIYVAPTSDADLEVSYYAKLGAFTGDSSTDAILTAHPRIYLAGVLEEALSWIGDDAREMKEGMKFALGVKGLNANDKQAQTSGSVLIARTGSAP